MKKFELFMGCFGNGITVCNKAVEENGDYKQIAHIADCGKIKWYVNPYTYVPGNELLRIEHAADAQGANWEKWFSGMPEIKQYGFLLDHVPHKDFMHIANHKELDLPEKIKYLKKAYYNAI